MNENAFKTFAAALIAAVVCTVLGPLLELLSALPQ